MGRVAPRDPPGWSFMVLPPFRMWGGSSMVILGTIPQGIVQFDMSDIALMPLKPDFDVLPQETSDFNGTQNRTAASIPLCYDTSHGDETNRMYQMYSNVSCFDSSASKHEPPNLERRRKQLGDKWKAGTFCELRTPIRPPKLRAKTSNTLRPSQAELGPALCSQSGLGLCRISWILQEVIQCTAQGLLQALVHLLPWRFTHLDTTQTQNIHETIGSARECRHFAAGQGLQSMWLFQ